MRTYDRRAFIKGSAMLTAAAAAARVLPSNAAGSPLKARRQAAEHPFFANVTNKPEVIAHRGGDGQWPGETMYAMRKAAKIGADVLELDVYHTKDIVRGGRRERGELVLMHDVTVGTTTEGDRRVYEYDLEEIKKLNAGYRWSPDGGRNHPYEKAKDLAAERPGDLRVPTLREVFEEFPDKRMVVEMKWARGVPSPAQKLCELIREKKMQDRVLVASFWSPFMNEFRGLCPEVATSATISFGDLRKMIAELRSVLAGASSPASGSRRPVALQVPYQLFKSKIAVRLLERVKRHGIKLHAWTVNDLDDVKLLRAWDVDGVITDYPGLVLTLLGRAQPA